MAYITASTVSTTTSQSLIENIGNQTPDGGLFADSKIAFYPTSTPVSQAAAITAITAGGGVSELATAVNAIIVALGATSGVGLTA